MAEPELRRKLLAENRRARHEYEFLETIECGIALVGTEVKSLRQGKASIAEAFAMIRAGELWLINAHIPEYSHGNLHNHLPTRDRRLLVHKRELAGWDRKVREKGVTMVPLALYFKGPRVKLSIGLARGKKLHDKRATMKDRDDRREIERALSRRR